MVEWDMVDFSFRNVNVPGGLAHYDAEHAAGGVHSIVCSFPTLGIHQGTFANGAPEKESATQA
jgi:hypothetical protein